LVRLDPIFSAGAKRTISRVVDAPDAAEIAPAERPKPTSA
jgi:hypothetical protein